jgi:hypothetical protein
MIGLALYYTIPKYGSLKGWFFLFERFHFLIHGKDLSETAQCTEDDLKLGKKPNPGRWEPVY